MATQDRTDVAAPADAVAQRLGGATFATLLARADGESLAAAGLLADACVATATPYQVGVVRTRAEFRSRVEATDETSTTVAIGVEVEPDETASDGTVRGPKAASDAMVDRPSVTAFEAADVLGADPDPALALGGVVAGGATPEDAAPGILERAGLERRPGVGAPTDDPAEALAHSTLVHAAYSGDPEAAEAVVADLPEDDDAPDRRLASLLAIDAVSADGATERAAHAIERAIRPLAGGPVGTVEGLGDLLGALAAAAPGRAVALAIGGDGRAVDPALDAWREHAVAAHSAVRSAETERHGGIVVARTDGPVEAVARLLRDFRSPEPAVLAIGTGGVETPGDAVDAALATLDAPADPIEAAAADAGGSGLARGNYGYARVDGDRVDAFVDAVREAI